MKKNFFIFWSTVSRTFPLLCLSPAWRGEMSTQHLPSMQPGPQLWLLTNQAAGWLSPSLLSQRSSFKSPGASWVSAQRQGECKAERKEPEPVLRHTCWLPWCLCSWCLLVHEWSCSNQPALRSGGYLGVLFFPSKLSWYLPSYCPHHFSFGICCPRM